jgi:Tfp pilus assembly protein PilO
MKNFSAKNKMIILAVVWIAMSAAMLGYLFNIMDSSNQAQLDAMAGDRKNLAQLEAERESYNRARQDLTQMSKEAYQPDDLFSKDINFVKELEILENLSSQLNLKMTISGVNGTVSQAAKAKTLTALAVVPNTITLSGSLSSTVDFVETLEHLSFITNVNAVNIQTEDQGNVTLNLASDFYLQK